MMIRPEGVLLAATLSALAAGGGVLQLNIGRPVAAVAQGRVAKAADGHYWANAEVNGVAVRFLIDTGSSAVVLTPEDAVRVGVDLTRLRYDRPVFTAAGGEEAAAVTLDHVAVDGARVEKVNAVVMRHGSPASLLGMSYLGRLSKFEATPRALVLTR
jgi:aspartyl protease family protein